MEFALRERVVERAGGSDELTATNRLMEEARANVTRWISSTSAAEKLIARIRVCPMEEALDILTKTGCVNWFTTKGV